MGFGLKEVENIKLISGTNSLVKVVGANYMGQTFETRGLILNENHFKSFRKPINNKYFLLDLGQVDEVARKRNFLPMFSDFQNSRGLCVHKIYDMSGRLLYENENFSVMNDDRKWELKKFYGFEDSHIEDMRGKIAKFVGKPVIVKGERLALLAVGTCEYGAHKVYVCCTDGVRTTLMEIDGHQIELDKTAVAKIASSMHGSGSGCME